MLRFWKRRDEFADLEADLRNSRPAPSEAAVKAAADRVRPRPQWLRARTRFAAAAVLTTVALTLAAVFGGMSFAAFGVHKAASVVNVVKRIDKPSKPRLVTKSPTLDQYGHHCGAPHNPPCHIRINSVQVQEGLHACFTVSLDNRSDGTAKVDFATDNGSGVAGEDYRPTSGTLSFPAEQTSGTICVETLKDAPDPHANPETFFVRLSNPVNAIIDSGTGTGTILQ